MSSSTPLTAPEPADRSTRSRSMLRRGLQVVGIGIVRQPGAFAVAVVGSALYGVMTVGNAWAIGHVFAEVVTPAVAAGRVGAGQLATAFGWVAGVVLLTTVGVIGRRLGAARISFNLAALYRRLVTRQYVTLPLSWHHRHPSGQLLSNANADVEAAWNIFNPLPMALGVIVMLAVAAVQMVLIDVWLALVALLVFPALFAANAVFQRFMSPRAALAQQLRGEVSEVAHESFEGALVVKTLGRQDVEDARFGEVSDRLRVANVSVGRAQAIFDPVIEALPVLGTLAVLGVGAARVADGRMSTADLVQIAYLFSMLAFPVRAFGWVLGSLPRSVVGWERVQAVLAATGAMPYGEERLPGDGPLTVELSGVQHGFDIVDTTGAPGRHEVLRGVDLTVPAGRTVALAGATGSGKSTLVDLVARLVDPDGGLVRFDGTDARELARTELSGAVALASQDVFVFDDTIAGNVTLGEPAEPEAIWQALRVAAADDFVERLPDGLDTQVGERGTSLSGGQRQRLALARAVFRRPRLLVLDDATSAVDPPVERAILDRLRGATAGMSVLVVAHRVATLAAADEVLLLADGVIVDHGPHHELVARCPQYAALVTAYAQAGDDLAVSS